MKCLFLSCLIRIIQNLWLWEPDLKVWLSWAFETHQSAKDFVEEIASSVRLDFCLLPSVFWTVVLNLSRQIINLFKLGI